MPKYSMRVVFRVDSSITIGAGHLSRCVTLAEELIKKGRLCTIYLS